MNLDTLRSRNALLRNLDDDAVAFFASVAREYEFAPQAVIIEEDTPTRTFYIVAAGKVGLEVSSPGRAPIVLQTLGPGEMVGVSWLFEPYRWNLRARALMQTSAVGFDAARVREECARDCLLGYKIAYSLAEESFKRLQGARLQLLDLYEAADR